jgi:hypothetical protein
MSLNRIFWSLSLALAMLSLAGTPAGGAVREHDDFDFGYIDPQRWSGPNTNYLGNWSGAQSSTFARFITTGRLNLIYFGNTNAMGITGVPCTFADPLSIHRFGTTVRVKGGNSGSDLWSETFDFLGSGINGGLYAYQEGDITHVIWACLCMGKPGGPGSLGPFLAGQLQARWYVCDVTTNADPNFLQLQILVWGNFNGDKTGLNPDQDYALEMNWDQTTGAITFTADGGEKTWGVAQVEICVKSS